MKTCSDSLTALLHQYRTGERKTWYIADLYTMWINNAESETLGWTPSVSSDDLIYVDARFDKGLYLPPSYIADSRAKITCPPNDVFDWDRDDWTIEFFVQTPFDDGYWTGIYYPPMLCFAVTTSTIPPLAYNGRAGLFATFWYGEEYDYHANLVASCSISCTYHSGSSSGIWNGGVSTAGDAYPVPEYSFNHVAFYKKDRVLYAAINGKIKDRRDLTEYDEHIYIPPDAYMHILATNSPDGSEDETTGIIDELRISTCCRYPTPDYWGNDPYPTYTMPTEPFVTDENTMSLLHLDGSLEDEGFLGGSISPIKDFRSGEIFLYTGHDTDLTCGGNKYHHIAIEHGDIEESRGTETATMDLTINYNPTDTIAPNDDRTWFKAFKDGVFDKAYLSLDRLYSPIPWQYNMPNIPIDYVLKSRFFGRMDIQEVKVDHATIQVKSPTDMLSREIPRNLVKPSCLNHFGDFMCQIDINRYKKPITALNGSTQSVIMTTNTIGNEFNNGMIYSTSGKNKGQYSSIKTCSNGQIVLFKPFTESVSVGDTFDILCGCDKTLKMCRDTYSNIGHFRGFPFLPCKNVLL